MKQKEIKQIENEMYSLAITLRKFLVMYYGVSDDDIYKLKMSHKDIKKMIPELRRTSKESLLNLRKNLYTGEIIAVKDSYGNIAPYICPKECEQLIPKKIDTKEIEIEITIKDIIDNEDLQPYQLSALCNEYKLAKRFKEYNIAKRILKSKLSYQNRKVKKYKKEKEDLKMKEIENEYKRK